MHSLSALRLNNFLKQKYAKVFGLFSKRKGYSSAKTKGFTLIELLVVIGILGILAAALIATIDPFEQLKKANDSNIKNAVVEYLNANVRYYTTHNTFPWDTVVNGGAACNGSAAPDAAANPNISINDSPLSTCTTALVSEKELKTGFGNATNVLKEIYITFDATTNTLTGCFRPQSTSQRKAPDTKYTKDGADVASPTTACEGYGGVTQCYWCTK
ncbi:MAG: hypothetical protein COU27_00550 [Candidatus Levybacteria bacterium CG10_big_fil_rev_8_21_14_0_10_36_7]|nr:MAG: hypothetical protein COU27_00550 [Candidatus Levybacteria bacterium CG10_big_fil_rev_8_21_14_0_10_36_7]